MNYTLVPVEAPGAAAISLIRPVLLVGRLPDCDVRINSSKISRRHCCLALAYDRVVIRDLGSHNGVRVNGRVVDESRLYPEDEVAIGPLIYRMVAEPDHAEGSARANARPLGAPPDRPGGQPGPENRAAGSPSPGDSNEVGLVPLEDQPW